MFRDCFDFSNKLIRSRCYLADWMFFISSAIYFCNGLSNSSANLFCCFKRLRESRKLHMMHLLYSNSNSNSKYVYCQDIEIQHVYNCQHCVSYTLQSNRYQMEWNGNGACRPAANPGTTAPGLPSWCRHWHWGPETTRPNRGSGARRWNFGQPIPRWAAVARPKVGAPG